MQSSVAKFMAQRQLQKTFRNSDSLNAIQKPTASVAPVVQKDSESSLQLSPMSNCDNLSDCSKSSTSSTSTATALEFPDCDNKSFHQQNSNSLYNEDKVNSILDISERSKSSQNKPGQFSLLTNNSTGRITGNKINNTGDIPSVNGEVFQSDVDLQEEDKIQNSEAVLRLRNTSGDSVPSPTNKCWDREHMVNGRTETNGKGVVINQNCIGKVMQANPPPVKVGTFLGIPFNTSIHLKNCALLRVKCLLAKCYTCE